MSKDTFRNLTVLTCVHACALAHYTQLDNEEEGDDWVMVKREDSGPVEMYDAPIAEEEADKGPLLAEPPTTESVTVRRRATWRNWAHALLPASV